MTAETIDCLAIAPFAISLQVAKKVQLPWSSLAFMRIRLGSGLGIP
jgi:hypothetical protein